MGRCFAVRLVSNVFSMLWSLRWTSNGELSSNVRSSRRSSRGKDRRSPCWPDDLDVRRRDASHDDNKHCSALGCSTLSQHWLNRVRKGNDRSENHLSCSIETFGQPKANSRRRWHAVRVRRCLAMCRIPMEVFVLVPLALSTTTTVRVARLELDSTEQRFSSDTMTLDAH